MSEASICPDPSAYQLGVVLRGASPLIWRRLLVRSDRTIADLHATLQTTLGWSDAHLNRFVIYGSEYGVSLLGGIGFRDNPRRVRLVEFGLGVGERFLYEYDFTDGWQHDVGVERILPFDPRRPYPVCVGGWRAIPPQDCGGWRSIASTVEPSTGVWLKTVCSLTVGTPHEAARASSHRIG